MHSSKIMEGRICAVKIADSGIFYYSWNSCSVGKLLFVTFTRLKAWLWLHTRRNAGWGGGGGADERV